MQRPPLSDELRRFVATQVRSVPYLEAMLLARSAPDKVWDAAAMAKRLYSNKLEATRLLGELAAVGILRQSPPKGFSYAPADDWLRHLIDQLAEAYAKDLTGITDIIHSSADQRAYQFADAFRIRKEK
jgi:hypothetical protein